MICTLCNVNNSIRRRRSEGCLRPMTGERGRKTKFNLRYSRKLALPRLYRRMCAGTDAGTFSGSGSAGTVSLKQFENPANPQAHYETTGPEIYRDLGSTIDYVVAGAGSGGTYTGILRYLKEQKPTIRGVLADPVGSTIGGGEHADYDIEGISNDFIPQTMDISLVDQVIKITDDDAFSGSRLLASREGIFGGALSAALKLIRSGATGRIVVVLPDRGDRYFSKNL